MVPSREAYQAVQAESWIFDFDAEFQLNVRPEWQFILVSALGRSLGNYGLRTSAGLSPYSATGEEF